MLKAYADEHVSSAIVQALRQRNLDVLIVRSIMREANRGDYRIACSRVYFL